MDYERTVEDFLAEIESETLQRVSDSYFPGSKCCLIVAVLGKRSSPTRRRSILLKFVFAWL